MTSVNRTVLKLLLVLVAMSVFTVALVPLYNVFCQITGLNGKAASQPQGLVQENIDDARFVTVQFIARTGQGLPWKLVPMNPQVRVHPGQAYEVNFAFTNYGSQARYGRAVPSVSPPEASLHLRKVTCFCFAEQRLEAGEQLELPLVFQLSKDLPDSIHTVTLAYTLYPSHSYTMTAIPDLSTISRAAALPKITAL